MMKILILSPFGAMEPHVEENLRQLARSDVSLSFECLKDVFPLPYNTYRYNTMKCIDGFVERVIRAEQEGYLAVVSSYNYDPGVYEARSVVDIPVVANLFDWQRGN